ncbi:MAG: hypothetical protein QM762_24480 [Chryseolinea sp.]
MKSLQAYTTLLEKIFLVGLVIGGVFFVLHLEPFDVTVTAVSLFGLALAFFLSAYKSNVLPNSDDKLQWDERYSFISGSSKSAMDQFVGVISGYRTACTRVR